MNMTRKARVAVIGGGAMGGIVAAAAYESGLDVTLCVRTPITQLSIENEGETRNIPLRIISVPDGEPPADFVMLATKAQDTAGAAPWLRALLGPESVLVVLQNGIEHVERVRAYAGEAEILPALLYIGGELVAPGRIRHFTGTRMVVPEGAAGVRLASLMTSPRLEVAQTGDFLTAAWKKLILNASGNTVTTLTMQRIRVVNAHEGIRKLSYALMREIVAIGNAAGARLSEKDIEFALKAFRDARDTGSSMLYDRMSGRPLEHEHLTGAVLRTAKKLGLDVPLTEAMHALLDALDKSRI